MFNPVPQDAPIVLSSKAHYVKTEHKGSWGADMSDGVSRSRFYLFTMGRSSKVYWLRDKYLDDQAGRLLEQCKGKRLVIKGYLVPTRSQPTVFIVLTHFGLFHKPRRSAHQVFNPLNGELGFYKLNLKRRDKE